MISGIDLKQTVDYIVEDDKENPTVWKLGMITSSQMSSIAMAAAGEGDQVKQMVKLVRLGLHGWENFKLNDKEIIFARDDSGVPESLMDIIPLGVIVELGTKLLSINKLLPGEEKN